MNYQIPYKKNTHSIIPFFLIFFLFNLYSLSANAAGSKPSALDTQKKPSNTSSSQSKPASLIPKEEPKPADLTPKEEELETLKKLLPNLDVNNLYALQEKKIRADIETLFVLRPLHFCTELKGQQIKSNTISTMQNMLLGPLREQAITHVLSGLREKKITNEQCSFTPLENMLIQFKFMEKFLKEQPLTADLQYVSLLQILHKINPGYPIANLLTPNDENKQALEKHFIKAFEKSRYYNHKTQTTTPFVYRLGSEASVFQMLIEVLTNCSATSSLDLDQYLIRFDSKLLRSYRQTIDLTLDAQSASAKERFHTQLLAAQNETLPVPQGLTKPLQHFSLYDTSIFLNKMDGLSVQALTTALNHLQVHFLNNGLASTVNASLKKNQDSLITQLASQDQDKDLSHLKRTLIMNYLTPLLILPNISAGEVYLKLAEGLLFDDTGEARYLANILINSIGISVSDIYISESDYPNSKQDKTTSADWTCFSDLIKMINDLEKRKVYEDIQSSE